MASVELLLDARAIIAESLLWEPGAGVLYWTDIKAPALFRLDPRTMANQRWDLPEDVGAFALLEGGGEAVVGLRSGVFVLSLRTGAVERLAAATWDPARFRFNEGACDAAGRFWLGCMCDPPPGGDDAGEAPLHVWTGAGGLRAVGHEARLHNGMAWGPGGGTFYMSHSMAKNIWQYDYAPDGSLGPARLFATLDGVGIPDGAAVDEEGAYWCADHGGGALRRFAPDGVLLRTIAMPVSQPTMCAFGGPDLRTLFVSSASDKLSPAERAREKVAGGLFVLDPGVRGLPKPTETR